MVILPGFLPEDLMAAYEEEWRKAHDWIGLFTQRGVNDPNAALILGAGRPRGWADPVPYMRHPALRELSCYGPLAEKLEELLGEPAGVHLNLTGWVSTERNWHQDGYLNPAEVSDHYAAVWMALGGIHEDSGPFQYVPGSHRWHRLLRERFAKYVDLDDKFWPQHTEQILTPLVEDRMAELGVKPVTYLPRRGDVLIWHARLYHRGSPARVQGAFRPAVISHYSGIDHRPDMPQAVQHEAGGWFFPLSR